MHGGLINFQGVGKRSPIVLLPGLESVNTSTIIRLDYSVVVKAVTLLSSSHQPKAIKIPLVLRKCNPSFDKPLKWNLCIMSVVGPKYFF